MKKSARDLSGLVGFAVIIALFTTAMGVGIYRTHDGNGIKACTVESKSDGEIHTYDCGDLDVASFDLYDEITAETKYDFWLEDYEAQDIRIVEVQGK